MQIQQKLTISKKIFNIFRNLVKFKKQFENFQNNFRSV